MKRLVIPIIAFTLGHLSAWTVSLGTFVGFVLWHDGSEPNIWEKPTICENVAIHVLSILSFPVIVAALYVPGYVPLGLVWSVALVNSTVWGFCLTWMLSLCWGRKAVDLHSRSRYHQG